MEAVMKLHRHVRGDTSTPTGDGQLSLGKTQQKVSMLRAYGLRVARTLLAHVNLLLVLYGGASLATAARLRWDPTTYIAVRELLPVEYAAAAVAAAVGGLILLLLPHLAAAALLSSRDATRRILLLVYAGAMSALVLCELVLGVWLAWRLRQWLDSDAAGQLFNVIELRYRFKPILKFFGRWFQAPQHLDHLIKEAEEDAPRNLYVAVTAGAVLALLQPLAIALAICVARRDPPAARPTDANVALAPRLYSARASGDSEKAPLDPVYENFVVV